MRQYTLKGLDTTYTAIKKFEANHFLVQNETYKFTSKKEAEKSPLAQMLFGLEYVETIYIADNSVAVKINEKTAWETVYDEVYALLKDYLNAGKPIVKVDPKAKKKRFPVTVYTEMTPNPGVLKFVCNKKLVLQKIQLNYDEAADNYPLIKSLFTFPFVKRVAIENNHISVTKGGEADWQDIMMELREFIRDYLMRGKPVLLDS